MEWAAKAVREYNPGVCEQRLVTSGEGHGKTSENSEKQMALVSGWAERLSRLQGSCCPAHSLGWRTGPLEWLESHLPTSS